MTNLSTAGEITPSALRSRSFSPEIDIDKVNKITGLDITFVTTAQTNEEAFELLKEMGMPFKNVKKEITN
jgi:ribosomal protein L5